MSGAIKISMDDLDNLIEQKLLEMLGDPDSGLRLEPEFKKKLVRRMKKTTKRVSQREVMKRFGRLPNRMD